MKNKTFDDTVGVYMSGAGVYCVLFRILTIFVAFNPEFKLFKL
jgi:hypothetical protein